MSWSGFIDQMVGWFDKRGLARPRANWVLGVSGGPDSTLLLHAMREISERAKLHWELHVAHVHHHLRPATADADAEFVARLADELNLPFHRADVDVRAEVAAHGGATEEVARNHRYAFFERVALKTGSDWVAVAHHADDDAETVIHRICRGTGLRGLAGMREIRPIQPGSRVKLVRPLLEERRKTIEALCQDRGLSFRRDETNESAEFTRGRIRNVILPFLREHANPHIDEAVLRLAEQARWLGTYLEDAAARTFDSLVISDGPRTVVLNTNALLAKQRIIQAEVVRRALAMVADGEQDLGFLHVDAVLRLAESGASGKELHLPGPAVVRKTYDRLEFKPLTDPDAPQELRPVFVTAPGVTPLPALGFELLAEYMNVDETKIAELRQSPNPREEWIDCERVQFPLLVRGRRDGDRFWPLGAPGSKTIGDFLSDEKIDRATRARTGVLCDQVGPLWVMPFRIDERVKLRPTTERALRLLLRPISSEAGRA